MLGFTPASAESLAEAMVSAYANNPTLNAQRAALRATDEGVPQALSGYRPTVVGVADAGIADSDPGSTTRPWGFALSIEQPIYSGHRTFNGVKAAESAVLAGREALRAAEQDTLLATVEAFMGLVQAQAILNLRRQNVEFQQEQVRAANDRLNVGEGTRTDVAQTNASLAAGQSLVNAAAASVNAEIAGYELVVGHRPTTLGTANSVEPMLPSSLQAALDAAMVSNPSILAAGYNVDVAAFNVKILEGAKLPTVSVTGSLSHRGDVSAAVGHATSASLVGKVTVPIYQAGNASSKVRQAKETLGQRRIEHDSARAQIRQAVISAWGSLDAARAQIRAADARVAAERLVLSGVTEERKVGQRTTLDVLDAQQSLLDARVGQVSAQHDRVVAAYSLLSAIGKLDAASLGLNVVAYDPTDHYHQVRDAWHGVRTPDGR